MDNNNECKITVIYRQLSRPPKVALCSLSVTKKAATRGGKFEKSYKLFKLRIK